MSSIYTAHVPESYYGPRSIPLTNICTKSSHDISNIISSYAIWMRDQMRMATRDNTWKVYETISGDSRDSFKTQAEARIPMIGIRMGLWLLPDRVIESVANDVAISVSAYFAVDAETIDRTYFDILRYLNGYLNPVYIYRLAATNHQAWMEVLEDDIYDAEPVLGCTPFTRALYFEAVRNMIDLSYGDYLGTKVVSNDPMIFPFPMVNRHYVDAFVDAYMDPTRVFTSYRKYIKMHMSSILMEAFAVRAHDRYTVTQEVELLWSGFGLWCNENQDMLTSNGISSVDFEEEFRSAYISYLATR